MALSPNSSKCHTCGFFHVPYWPCFRTHVALAMYSPHVTHPCLFATCDTPMSSHHMSHAHALSQLDEQDLSDCAERFGVLLDHSLPPEDARLEPLLGPEVLGSPKVLGSAPGRPPPERSHPGRPGADRPTDARTSPAVPISSAAASSGGGTSRAGAQTARRPSLPLGAVVGLAAVLAGVAAIALGGGDAAEAEGEMAASAAAAAAEVAAAAAAAAAAAVGGE